MKNDKLLEIDGLTVTFQTDDGLIKAVDDLSFCVRRGEIVGLVGESGCGKSVTALSILRLIPAPSGKIENGSILFKGRDLLKLDPVEMRKIRGRAAGMIFQEPSASLSPLHRIGQQMVETVLLHKDITRKKAWIMAETWLEKVGISDAKERMHLYPHQMSGGMQQRVMIAMAMMLRPDLIVADEPTTALDVTTQLQIFELIHQMRQKDSSVLLITHDMGIIWEMCNRVYVMYASRIAEQGSLNDIFSNPGHPYTRGLLMSIPKLSEKGGRLKAISGQVPSPFDYPAGCHFQDRCSYSFDRCAREKPEFVDLGNGHRAACFLAGKI